MKIVYKDDLWLFIDKLASFGYSINKKDQKSKVTVLAFDVVQKKKGGLHFLIMSIFYKHGQGPRVDAYRIEPKDLVDALVYYRNK